MLVPGPLRPHRQPVAPPYDNVTDALQGARNVTGARGDVRVSCATVPFAPHGPPSAGRADHDGWRMTMSVQTNDQPGRTASAESVADSATRNRDAMMDEVRSAVGTARDTAATATAKAPEVATATRGAMSEAMRQMEAGSDQALTTGAAFALGAAMGLLVGGAPRLLVVATLVPVAAAGMILLDRRGAMGRPSR
jgi:hypothetical protein